MSHQSKTGMRFFAEANSNAASVYSNGRPEANHHPRDATRPFLDAPSMASEADFAEGGRRMSGWASNFRFHQDSTGIRPYFAAVIGRRSRWKIDRYVDRW